MLDLGRDDLLLLLLLILAAAFDLGIRWLAFRRVESVAIDVAIFSAMYSSVRTMESVGDDIRVWAIKTGLAIVVLIGLSVLHRILKDEFDARIKAVFDKAAKGVVERDVLELITSQSRVAVLALDLSLSREGKPGKKRRRALVLHALELVRRLGGQSAAVTDPHAFMLDSRTSAAMIMLFLVGTILALVIPVLHL